MDRINIKRFSLAVGTTFAIIYIGCVIVTALISPERTTMFVNNLMHSVDVSAIIRKTPMHVSEVIMGVVEWFIIGWFAGAGIAAIYNAGNKISNHNSKNP